MRPEDAAARQVPIPQAAASAIERGVDAAAHGVVDQVALAGAGRLPVERKPQDQHDKAGRGRQRHRQRGVRPPQRIDIFLDDDDLTRQRLDQVSNRQRAIAVGQRNVRDAGLLQPWRGQRQRRADDVEQLAGIAERCLDRNPRQHALVGADHDDMPAGCDGPGRDEAWQCLLQAFIGRAAILPDRGDAVDSLGEIIGNRGEVAFERCTLLPALIDHLNEGAEANGDQEGDDQGRHGTAQRRLRYQKPVVGWFRDRLRQSLDRIGLNARARRVCARHACCPLGNLIAPVRKSPSPFPNHSDLNPVFAGCRESTIR